MTALLLALVPALAMRWINDPELADARDLWLLAVLGLGAGAVWPTAPWLSCIACWFLIRWRSMDLVPSLVTWMGIGASWYLLRALPGWAWEWLPAAWLIVALWHVAVLAVQYDRRYVTGVTGARQVEAPTWLLRITDGAIRWRTSRPWGLLGSGPTTALYLTLVSPFAPWPVWLVLMAGIYLTGSYVALSAALIGFAVVHVSVAPLMLAGVALAALGAGLMLWQEAQDPFKRRWAPYLDRFTTHRGSLDGLRLRLNVWRVLWLVAHRSTWRVNVMGRGPSTLEAELERRSFAWEIALPEGGSFNEFLWMAWDLGAFGVVAMGLFALQTLKGFQVGDPWSAALVTGAVLACGHFPMRLPQTGLVFLAVGARLSL